MDIKSFKTEYQKESQRHCDALNSLKQKYVDIVNTDELSDDENRGFTIVKNFLSSMEDLSSFFEKRMGGLLAISLDVDYESTKKPPPYEGTTL